MIPERKVEATALLRDSARDSWIACFPAETFIERLVNEARVPLAAVVPHAVVSCFDEEPRTFANICLDVAMCTMVLAEAIAVIYFCLVV